MYLGCVNVNTTDATTGATALLLPAQNTHTLPGKKTPGGAGTHTVPVKSTGGAGSRDTHGTHTGHAGAQGHTDHTDEPHNHPNPPTLHANTPGTQHGTHHEHTTRHTTPNPHTSARRPGSRGRLNSRRPGADRSPRPTPGTVLRSPAVPCEQCSRPALGHLSYRPPRAH